MRRVIALVLTVLAFTCSAFAQVPNHKAVVEQVFREAPWDLREKSENGCFTEEVAYRLHQLDPNWGHLRKFGGQNQWNGHAVDNVLHKSGYAVDIIGSSESPDAKPSWTVDKMEGGQPRYTDTATYFIVPTAGCAFRRGTPPPVPPTPVVDTGELKALRAHLDQRLTDIETSVYSQLSGLRQQFHELQEAVAAAVAEVNELDALATTLEKRAAQCYRGSTRITGAFRLCPE